MSLICRISDGNMRVGGGYAGGVGWRATVPGGPKFGSGGVTGSGGVGEAQQTQHSAKKASMMRSVSAHRWHKKPAMGDVGVYRCQKISEMRQVKRLPLSEPLCLARWKRLPPSKEKEECEAKDERNLEPEILHESIEC